MQNSIRGVRQNWETSGQSPLSLSIYSLVLFKEKNINKFQSQITIIADFSKIAANMKLSSVQFWILQSPGSLRRQKGEKFRTSGRLPLLRPFNSLVVCCFPYMNWPKLFACRRAISLLSVNILEDVIALKGSYNVMTNALKMTLSFFGTSAKTWKMRVGHLVVIG